MNIFHGKTAIVTGAASGIGKALSKALARKGAIVILADVNAEALEKTASEIQGTGQPIESAILDVTKFDDVQKLVNDTIIRYGHLDYMFNNAGIAVFSEARDYTYENEWCHIINVDLYGPVNGAAAAFPIMVHQGFGHIINTASLAGLMPAYPFCSYSVAKHGVVGLSLALRMEGADLGVNVSVVCPGLIQTPMYHSRVIKLDQQKLLEKAPEGMPPERCAEIILKGVKRNKAIIVVSIYAKILWILYRLNPFLMLKLGTLFIRRSRKEFRTDT